MALFHVPSGVNVAAAGTAQPLSATSIPASRVLVTAKSSNTGSVYLGAENVNSTSYGVILAAGDAQPLDAVSELNVYDLSKIFIDADNNGEGVWVLYVVH
jgi:hypothetical protein